MKIFLMSLTLLVGMLFFSTGCEGDESGNTQVRFENNSSKTVYAVWDGSRTQTLFPGQNTDYMDVNPGTHTLMWRNAINGGVLTSVAWPNIVAGQRYSFPYN
jgi:hypothetical protein